MNSRYSFDHNATASKKFKTNIGPEYVIEKTSTGLTNFNDQNKEYLRSLLGDLDAKKYLVLTGRNGCGKSKFFKSLQEHMDTEFTNRISKSKAFGDPEPPFDFPLYLTFTDDKIKVENENKLDSYTLHQKRHILFQDLCTVTADNKVKTRAIFNFLRIKLSNVQSKYQIENETQLKLDYNEKDEPTINGQTLDKSSDLSLSNGALMKYIGEKKSIQDQDQILQAISKHHNGLFISDLSASQNICEYLFRIDFDSFFINGLNNLLNKFGFKYEIEASLDNEGKFSWTFKSKSVSKVNYDELSSGERHSIWILMMKFICEKIKEKSLTINKSANIKMFLNELGSFLDQFTIAQLMTIVTDDLTLNFKIIISTHNMMTVSFLDDEHIFCLENDLKQTIFLRYEYKLANSMLTDYAFIGICKQKIRNPQILEDLIIETDGLLFKNFGDPIESLVRSYFFTPKVIDFMEKILKDNISLEKICYESVYDLDQMHSNLQLKNFSGKCLIVSPKNSLNKSWDFIILNFVNKIVYFLQISVTSDITRKLKDTFKDHKNITEEHTYSYLRQYLTSNFEISPKYYLIHGKMSNEKEIKYTTEQNKDILVNLVNLNNLGNIFNSSLMKKVNGIVFKIQRSIYDATDKVKEFLEKCFGITNPYTYIAIMRKDLIIALVANKANTATAIFFILDIQNEYTKSTNDQVFNGEFVILNSNNVFIHLFTPRQSSEDEYSKSFFENFYEKQYKELEDHEFVLFVNIIFLKDNFNDPFQFVQENTSYSDNDK